MGSSWPSWPQATIPFAFLLAALVFIVDGSLEHPEDQLQAVLRISISRTPLTPLHDHVRKRPGLER